MSFVYLCGNTGGINRGCEAIVRSTAKILRNVNASDIFLMTYNRNYDESIGLNKISELIDYPKKTFFQRSASCIMRKVFNNGTFGGKYLYRPLLKSINKNSVLFNVGGDVYCYNTPYTSYALNVLANEYHIPSVFWGCSVDERVLKDKKMQEDINRYSYIVVRESLSYSILKKVYHNSERLIQACDPAFLLDIKPVKLPKEFLVKNTVGINLSPLVFNNWDNENDIMYKNIFSLIEYILSDTDMNVCLIPHVYDIINNYEDSKVLRKVYSKYTDNNRVSLIDKEFSCEELKFIISNCRFFIGARTHSMIAAYSTGVPAFALSYSIKSKGIAKDLLGSEKYCVSYKDLSKDNSLKEIFINSLQKDEQYMLNRYNTVSENYKKTITVAAERIIKGI